MSFFLIKQKKNMIDKIPEDEMTKHIVERLLTVYDPDFPLIDIYTLWLVYDIQIDEDEKEILITMTYTTPACPSGDLIQEMMRNAVTESYPVWAVSIEVIFDPMWKIAMIKDQDLQRMFE